VTGIPGNQCHKNHRGSRGNAPIKGPPNVVSGALLLFGSLHYVLIFESNEYYVKIY